MNDSEEGEIDEEVLEIKKSEILSIKSNQSNNDLDSIFDILNKKKLELSNK